MQNKSTKILAILLGILFILFVTAAAYFLFYKDTQPPAPVFQVQSVSSNHQPLAASSQTPPATTPVNPELPLTAKSQKQASSTGGEAMMNNTKQVPRRLTEEQKAENQRELTKMAEALPDNMWVPKEPAVGGYNPEQGEKLRKSIELSDKIRKGSASAKEQAEYYFYKLKETKDKIDLIRYIAKRTNALAGQTGKEYLTQSDVATGEERIEELERLADKYQQKLSEINPDASE
jgi:hypothetical protein